MGITFGDLFSIAMGNKIAPYPFQIHLAEESWPDIVKIPTGMGKTAGIILGWLYKRLQGDRHTPRRLVYCLPMRVLVEQTADNAHTWVDNLVNANVISENERPAISVLMGGEIDKDWDRYPERQAILIGTQDQLLSRALNRGYTMSRFRWPIHFGLLNNDCIWVMDEVQLMGAGLTTTTQIQAFRDSLGTVYPVHSIWMSATFEKNWLNTVDFASTSENLSEHSLSAADTKNKAVSKLLGAKKTLQKAKVPADNEKK